MTVLYDNNIPLPYYQTAICLAKKNTNELFVQEVDADDVCGSLNHIGDRLLEIFSTHSACWTSDADNTIINAVVRNDGCSDTTGSAGSFFYICRVPSVSSLLQFFEEGDSMW